MQIPLLIKTNIFKQTLLNMINPEGYASNSFATNHSIQCVFTKSAGPWQNSTHRPFLHILICTLYHFSATLLHAKYFSATNCFIHNNPMTWIIKTYPSLHFKHGREAESDWPLCLKLLPQIYQASSNLLGRIFQAFTS